MQYFRSHVCKSMNQNETNLSDVKVMKFILLYGFEQICIKKFKICIYKIFSNKLYYLSRKLYFFFQKNKYINVTKLFGFFCVNL